MTNCQVPTSWSRRLFCWATAGPIANNSASAPIIRMNLMSSPNHVARRSAASGVSWIAIEQLDRDSLWTAQKADLYSGPRRMRFLGKLDTFFLQISCYGIDPRHRKAEMVEALIGRHRRRAYAIAGIDLSYKDLGSAELEIDTRLALLRRADHFGTEHAFEPLRRRLRIRRAQVNMVPREICHSYLSRFLVQD